RYSLLVLSAFVLQSATAQESWKMASIPVQTRWAKNVSPNNAWPEYPRPQLVRNNWQNLNGLWQYAITTKDAATPMKYDGQILVRFCIERSEERRVGKE